MSRTTSYPLNPADHVLLVTHESLRRRGYCGINVLLVADVHGELPPAELETAIGKLGGLYPALSASLRFSKVRQTPYWCVDSDRQGQRAIEYQVHQVSDDGAAAWEPLNEVLDRAVDLRRGPLLSLVHVRIGRDRHRLGLRWAHPLMDYEGGYRLLGALHDLLCNRTPALGKEPGDVFPAPFGIGFPSSFIRTWQGRWLYAVQDSYRQPRIVKRPEGASRRCRFLTRQYDSGRRRTFQALAKARISPGPLLYSRALLVALARTYKTMSTEQGRPREHFIIPMPLPLPRNGPRPGVFGNYVTIPWIVFSESDLANWSTADAVAARQFREYFEKGLDQATWYMYRAASRWPFGFTRLLTSHRRPRTAVVFTGYQCDGSVTHLGGAKITNLSGAGPPDCHPGWLVGHTTFEDTMSLSITYFEDYVDTPSVAEFFNRFEVEIFGARLEAPETTGSKVIK